MKFVLCNPADHMLCVAFSSPQLTSSTGTYQSVPALAGIGPGSTCSRVAPRSIDVFGNASKKRFLSNNM